MKNQSKKSIESLKDHEVDGQNVKGGFTLIRRDDLVAHYQVNDLGKAKQNALLDAKSHGFTQVTLIDKMSGKTFVHKFD
jgi:hypothetical protein